MMNLVGRILAKHFCFNGIKIIELLRTLTPGLYSSTTVTYQPQHIYMLQNKSALGIFELDFTRF